MRHPTNRFLSPLAHDRPTRLAVTISQILCRRFSLASHRSIQRIAQIWRIRTGIEHIGVIVGSGAGGHCEHCEVPDGSEERHGRLDHLACVLQGRECHDETGEHERDEQLRIEPREGSAWHKYRRSRPAAQRIDRCSTRASSWIAEPGFQPVSPLRAASAAAAVAAR